MAQTQGDIQVAHTHITVDTQNPQTAFCQGLSNAGTKAGLTGAAFTGYYCDELTQSQALPMIDYPYYKGITHKKQVDFPWISKFFHHIEQKSSCFFHFLGMTRK
jgi:hypothetical protein